MNSSRSSQAPPARKARFTPRRTALIHSLGAARSLFEKAKKGRYRTISGPGFNRSNRLAQLKCVVTASCCVSGRFFFAETIARFHYDGDDKIDGCLHHRSDFQSERDKADRALRLKSAGWRHLYT